MALNALGRTRALFCRVQHNAPRASQRAVRMVLRHCGVAPNNVTISRMQSGDRGYQETSVSKRYCSFNFGAFYAPGHDGFHSVRLLNEDVFEKPEIETSTAVARITGSSAGALTKRPELTPDVFVERDGSCQAPQHIPLDGFENLTIVLSGQMKLSKDPDSEVLGPAGVHYKSAGNWSDSKLNTSEDINPADGVLHTIQAVLWPSFDIRLNPPVLKTAQFKPEDMIDNLLCVVDGVGKGNAVNADAIHINQRARIYVCTLGEGKSITHKMAPGYAAYVHLSVGSPDLEVNDTILSSGDGCRVEYTTEISFTNSSDSPTTFVMLEMKLFFGVMWDPPPQAFE